MSPEESSQIIGRRYVLQELLGQGGMGAVYRAWDRLTGQTVALKRVVAVPSKDDVSASYNLDDYRLTLAQEFKLLASLRHPNIIGVLDYGFMSVNGGERQPYFTMELLENAQDILEAGRNEPLERKINLVVQILRALAYMHRRGILHRDLKPGNVLVVRSSDSLQVKVLDFGLSVMREHEDTATMTAGTLAYMAPEVLMSQQVGEAADLYAVGLMAYELIAGQHPFDVANAPKLINQILYQPIDTSELDVPVLLSSAIHMLLDKDPAQRIADASEAIASLSDALLLPPAPETAATRESFLQAARLVGRDGELRQLGNALEAALNGHGSAWLVGGESGVGKSRLVEELRALAMVRGALVMRGQTVSKGGVPYQMWQQVLRWLTLLVELDNLDAGIIKMLVPDAATLSDRETTDVSTLDGQTIQTRLLTVLETVLKQTDQPIVIFLEDLHWAGSESLAILTRLNRIVEALPLLVVASFRDDEQPRLPELLPDMRLLKLPRLNEHSIAELSVAMLGDAGRQPQVVGLLQRETEGNVFFLVEVVRALAEEAGRLEDIGRMTLPESVFAGGVQRIIERRLSRLTTEDRHLLEYAAVLGRQFDLNVLRHIAASVDLDLWLTQCSNATVLDVQDDEWRFAHDKLRDGLLATLTEVEKQMLHRRVAQAIETLYPNAVQQTIALAYHWGAAGDAEREGHYTSQAGQQALAIGAYREAAVYFQRALVLVRQPAQRNKTGGSVPLREADLKAKLAEAFLGFGRYEDARLLYAENLTLYENVKDELHTADTLCKLGDVALALGELPEARGRYEQALSLYKAQNVPAGIARALNSLGNVAYELGDDNTAKMLFQESLSLSREIGGQWGMAGAGSKGSGTAGYGTQSNDVRLRLERVLEQYYSTGNQRGIAETLVSLGTLAEEHGQYDDARQLYRKSLSLYETLADGKGRVQVLNRLGSVAGAAGDFAAARGYLRQAFQAALDVKDTVAALQVLVDVARLYVQQQQNEQALEVLAFVIAHPSSSEDSQNRAELLLMDLEEALPPQTLESAWERGKRRTLDEVTHSLLTND